MNTTTAATTLQYVAIPIEVAHAARTTMQDAFGHNLHVVKEQGPCRLCLRIAEGPEEMILLSYRPLPDRGPYAEIGPIFIHARECTPYTEPENFPRDFLSRPLILRAYDHQGRIVDAVVAQPGDAERQALNFLQNSSVAEVHVRHISYTCFDFKILGS
ncbi:MAG: DUF1203 domain-containing protein [Candidatus Baltobacteraceae bacterium]